MKEKEILTIIDANLNRLREALRVCEEVTRFVTKDKPSTLKLKRIRHEALSAVTKSKNLGYPSLILSRDTSKDIGKESIPQELKRSGAFSVLSANTQRAKESARVLEEFFKVIDLSSAVKFKKIRFKIYDIEKALIAKAQKKW